MINETDSRARGSDSVHAFEEASARLVELQLHLAVHWRQIIHCAAERFATRTETSFVTNLSVHDFVKAYEVWVECAEQSYAEAVSKEEYCQLQSELANVALRLLLELRAPLAPKGHS